MVSIRDIAKMAAVSPASVSRILNHDQNFSINEETRKRVIDIANRMHYSKEASKKGPRFNHDSMQIGLILRHNQESELNDPYFHEIHRGIEQEAARWRMRVITPFGMRDESKEWQRLKDFGAVIMVGEMTNEGIERVKQVNNNVILVDNYAEHPGVDVIKTDFAEKTQEILDLLYKDGHRKIAFIGGYNSVVRPDGSVIRDKREVRAVSYRNWMKLHDLQDEINIQIGRWSAEDGMMLATQILQNKDRPTAIVVASDPMAMGVYKAISKTGLTIPDDVSVVSFDDVEMNQYLVPSLSSVRMEAKEMGKTAVKLARDRMIEPSNMPMQLICASKLMIRESIKKLKK
ncbi:LacI family DNA-binding transcriptional regulator [Lactiplantibacillus pentosus]|uniref:LacI family transcriptional regulator n=1 Tax=Lactiplantibacillus pentosus TaxID=1589 RepID=A0AB37RFB8_LACPE|nr:LacI family DNA-binding transcriptional regulator [Lactiplantibacillus pentosus]RMW42320.1 LacI family transcriptional regulator [Lactiplantibacillus pentosus]RMW48510.1 LacI family transcriptional regulator [Lactiplantibacillus pentosus]RMW52647.1 LacI family transcriptional regulator [Lactiplantibacillus pentosus]RMW55381.1 LacI family transcriptional regulator [Lactiplantibacillus pentosus]